MTFSTAGSRIRLAAAGSVELSALQAHGPGSLIVNGPSAQSGLNTDGQGCGLCSMSGTSPLG
ncbi:hypothetical protein [Streptomyces akebiae]|uniref:Uncharacterized protein n=1 Tax=Streptomyces akebiae TaxID=2865673 RepID=A0ABX8Y1Y1_9ACTN|nr:hypothetical protein [Streptomyces akebiae]QYX81527.1 hypothetical protein K1J60_37665 [Streptomyces akebiae]